MSASERDTSIFQLKVTLKRIRPPIWRRIQVPGDTTLGALHHIIQVAMGWTNSHLHQFVVDGVHYGEPHPDYGLEMKDQEMVQLNDVVSEEKDKFEYEYDFGDRWEHTIRVEKVIEPDPDATYPHCVKGKRNCPPEDSGGPYGYGHMLEAIEDEDHPQHEQYTNWIRDDFDPEAFDLERVNQALNDMR
jgi:hypothetical protein